MKLGVLIGKRTWGGVIGINPQSRFVDGGLTTQPEYSFWFTDVGWGVENYGTDPDIEVEHRPQDFTAGIDPQLDRAIEEILQQMEENPPQLPDFGERPASDATHLIMVACASASGLWVLFPDKLKFAMEILRLSSSSTITVRVGSSLASETNRCENPFGRERPSYTWLRSLTEPITCHTF